MSECGHLSEWEIVSTSQTRIATQDPECHKQTKKLVFIDILIGYNANHNERRP